MLPETPWQPSCRLSTRGRFRFSLHPSTKGLAPLDPRLKGVASSRVRGIISIYTGMRRHSEFNASAIDEVRQWLMLRLIHVSQS